ncbi:unnamed protein product [Leptosia nina]|uniref:Uncharacterized protein n=1 Tax=Leptosia nina TaxID=320188 RepID=A0AAV1JWF6_9NEOP
MQYYKMLYLAPIHAIQTALYKHYSKKKELQEETKEIYKKIILLNRRPGLSNDRVPRCALSGCMASEHSWWYLSCSLVHSALLDMEE